jgi:two-component system OmpR family response regulator
MSRLLVAEDDLNALQGILSGLRRAGFTVDAVTHGFDAVERALAGSYDLMVLDLMLPGCSGFDVLEALHGRTSTPVLVLSARSELPARLRSFELGAVDYLPKPFFVEELVARVRARLGLREQTRRVVQVGGVEVDLDGRRAARRGVDLGLTGHEFNVLAWLIERPGRAVSREQLVERALGADGGQLDRTVDSHVSRVRRKLGAEGAQIRTVWGIGYRYDPEPA